MFPCVYPFGLQPAAFARVSGLFPRLAFFYHAKESLLNRGPRSRALTFRCFREEPWGPGVAPPRLAASRPARPEKRLIQAVDFWASDMAYCPPSTARPVFGAEIRHRPKVALRSTLFTFSLCRFALRPPPLPGFPRAVCRGPASGAFFRFAVLLHRPPFGGL